jgi:hypothetical protein
MVDMADGQCLQVDDAHRVVKAKEGIASVISTLLALIRFHLLNVQVARIARKYYLASKALLVTRSLPKRKVRV